MQTKSPPLRVPRRMTYEEWSRLGFILLQKWEGVVVESDAETFTAKLIDSHGWLKPHDATFARSELLKDEQELIEPGAPFVWTLGYRKIGSIASELVSFISVVSLVGLKRKLRQAKRRAVS